MFFDIIKSLIFGVIEGITEWLPISSTGHLILFEQLLEFENVSENFMSVYRVVIQLGAIMAVVIVFFDKLNPFSRKKTEKQRLSTYRMWFRVVVAVLPAAVIGFFVDDLVDEIFYNYITVAITLIVYGVLFIVLERYRKKKNEKAKYNRINDMSYKTALIIGGFQCLAFIPGTSRSGSTILGGMAVGTSRTVSAEFSFYLAIPVMFGASFFKIAKFILRGEALMTGAEVMLIIVGCIAAFIVSYFAVKFLMNFVKKHDFTAFGWYRIVLGSIVFINFIFSLIDG